MGTMTPLPSGYRTVGVPPARHHDLLVLDSWAFPSTVTDDQLEALPVSLTWDRARGVETGDGELVAFHGSYPYQQFPVPGAYRGVRADLGRRAPRAPPQGAAQIDDRRPLHAEPGPR